jgi:hypothetical protein
MIQLLLLSIWFIYIFVEAKVQGYLFKKDEGFKPDYLILFFVRGAASIIHGGPILHVENMAHYATLLIFQSTSFWIVFDLLLNKSRGKKWNYRGEQSGWLDRIDSDVLYWSLKILAVIGFFVSAYILLNT